MSGDHGNSVQHVWHVNKDVEWYQWAGIRLRPWLIMAKEDLPCTEHYCITVTQGLRNSNVHQLYRDHQRISTLLQLCPLSQQQWAFPGCGIACVIVADLLLPTSSLHIGILVCACAVGGLNFMQEGTLSKEMNPPLWVRTHINHIAHSLVPRPPCPSFYPSPWRPFRGKPATQYPITLGVCMCRLLPAVGNRHMRRSLSTRIKWS